MKSRQKAVSEYYSNSDTELSRRKLPRDKVDDDDFVHAAAREDRYQLYPEILECADFTAFSNCDVLEIGVGHGTDHVSFANAGARIVGIDVTNKHCRIATKAMGTYGHTSRISQADACQLPFADASFDHVYSFGVLFLIEEIEEAIVEIHRVLKPGCHATIMFYNKRSIHYYIKTLLFYRWALREDLVIGLDNVINWYTDGIGYPRVDYYEPNDLSRLFKDFKTVEYTTSCLTPEQVPAVGVPELFGLKQRLERRFGYFMWVKAWK